MAEVSAQGQGGEGWLLLLGPRSPAHFVLEYNRLALIPGFQETSRGGEDLFPEPPAVHKEKNVAGERCTQGSMVLSMPMQQVHFLK